MSLKQFDDSNSNSNEWDLKDCCLESICLELYSMLDVMQKKALGDMRIRNIDNEKIRLGYFKSFINGCNVLAQLLNQFDDVKSKKGNKRKPISAKTRLRVLDRDDYTCQICGRTVGDGVKLHIDHIKPLSKGGTNDETNLQVLCNECNLAKNNNENLKADQRKLIELGVVDEFY